MNNYRGKICNNLSLNNYYRLTNLSLYYSFIYNIGKYTIHMMITFYFLQSHTNSCNSHWEGLSHPFCGPQKCLFRTDDFFISLSGSCGSHVYLLDKWRKGGTYKGEAVEKEKASRVINNTVKRCVVLHIIVLTD